MNEFAGSNLDYTNHTVLHPIGLLAIIVLGAALLWLPRRWAIIPLLVMACFVAPAQRIVIASLNFNLLRVMVVFGWARILMRSEYVALRWKKTDSLMIALAVVATIAYTTLVGTWASFVNHLGDDFDSLGMYFLFRCLIRDWDDLRRAVYGLIALSIPVVFFFKIEEVTGRNLFSVLGGVPEITLVREGRVRCQGAFAHPIMAGCFWASVMPLMAALIWQGSARRWIGVIGVITAGAIVFLCASSTPILSIGLAILAAACFSIRTYMRLLRWSLLGIAVAMHLMMQAPIWHLLARIDVLGGSTGWHRYNLVNQWVLHFSQWWLVGTLDVPNWSQGLGDVTNEFVYQAVTGGLFSLTLFVLVIASCFGALGRIWRRNRGDRAKMIFAWALGISLFIHATNFIAVTYFGQIIMLWYMTLAAITSLDSMPQKAIVPAQQVAAPSRNRLRHRRFIASTSAVSFPLNIESAR